MPGLRLPLSCKSEVASCINDVDPKLKFQYVPMRQILLQFHVLDFSSFFASSTYVQNYYAPNLNEQKF